MREPSESDYSAICLSDLCPLNGLISRKTVLPTFGVLKVSPPEGHTKQKKAAQGAAFRIDGGYGWT